MLEGFCVAPTQNMPTKFSHHVRGGLTYGIWGIQPITIMHYDAYMHTYFVIFSDQQAASCLEYIDVICLVVIVSAHLLQNKKKELPIKNKLRCRNYLLLNNHGVRFHI